MEAFRLISADSVAGAIESATGEGAAYIAGGTDLMQLMKDNIEAPRQLVDIEALPLGVIEAGAEQLRLGALARMSDVAAHPEVQRGWPAISQALSLSASPQVRNMGTIGGNLLQRTRCSYFRDTGFACNKRNPGSGCPAITGENRMLAVLGTSEHCIATHPSDMPVALMALGAMVELQGPHGIARTVPLAEFYRLPVDTPQIETNLLPGELITAVVVPASAAARRSHYVKVRDRASFEFAVVSAAVGLEIEGGMVRDARVAMGGVAMLPWRMPAVESALIGHPANTDNFRAASMLASEGAKSSGQNAFKLTLMPRAVLRALHEAAA